jgi:hypothetical protein
MSVTRVPETNCLGCGAKLNAFGDLTDAATRGPKPGDPIACIRCGVAATVDESGAMRPFTEDEARELEADKDAMRELVRTVGLIYIARAMSN